MARVSNPWFGIGLEAFTLGLEAASVIALRSLRLAEGGARAQAEATRMVAEKIQAAAALSAMAATGGLGAKPATAASRTLRHYGRKVRANRRRLSKP
jgi:hypothetical protein